MAADHLINAVLELLKGANDEQCMRMIGIFATWDIAAPPPPKAEPTPSPRPKRVRRNDSAGAGSISKALDKIGRGRPDEILAAIVEGEDPVPHDTEEALRWVNRNISRMDKKKLRKWPDGSYSRVGWKPETV